VEFALATFVVSVVIIFGAYWAVVLRPEQAERSATIGRLRGDRANASGPGLVLSPHRLSSIPMLDRMLSHRRDLSAPVERLITESGLKLTVGGFVLMIVVTGLAAGVLVWLLTHLWYVSVLVGVLAAVVPYFYVSYVRSVRLRKFEEQFPEAIDLISRALRAGHAFTTGLGMVADEIPKPVGEEFRRLYDEQNFGMSLPDAMRAMAKRVPVLDARFFVTAVLTQRESGGNLSEVLDNLASVMRERFKLKRQIRVVSAHGRISAWILSCLPPALAGVLFLLSPDFMRILWEDPLGLRLVLAAIVLQITGTIIIARLVRIEY
jgi:tight adherence protein B